jgi:tRNA(Ile)-lysidine synthase
MNILRGAGPEGLCGIPSVRMVNKDAKARASRLVIRPLLGVSRDEIISHNRRHELTWRTDPTNRRLMFFRNRVRHRILPTLEREAPGLVRRLAVLSQIMRADADFILPQVGAARKRVFRRGRDRTYRLDLGKFLMYHKSIGNRVLRSVLGSGLTWEQIQDLCRFAVSPVKGGACGLPGGWTVQKRNNRLQFVPPPAQRANHPSLDDPF